jgi:uncharacterized membrane protein YdfJ with MMPL/SSD domain
VGARRRQQDNGALPASTEARRAYDGLTAGFGVGANGPLLISVDMAKQPAKADQSQLDKIDQQESDQKKQAKQKADSQEQQIAASLEAQGVPAAQAESRAQAQVQPDLDKQTKQIEDTAADQRKQADQPATDPRLQDLRTDLSKASGVKSVTQPLVNDPGTAAVMTVTPATAPSDRATETLVRGLLVPAVMTLLGRANWWFPGWLDRLVPNFSIEGEEWFRARDEAAARRPADERVRPDRPVPDDTVPT